VVQVARVLAVAPPWSPWTFEAPLRAFLRRMVILAGRSWNKADRIAFVLVAKGRHECGLRAPRGWDHVDDLPSALELRECLVCDRLFTPQTPHQVYCSARCNWRSKYIRDRRVKLKCCAKCGSLFESTITKQIYCSKRCLRAATSGRIKMLKRLERRLGRTCEQCGNPISEEANAAARFCSRRCAQRHWYLEHNEHREHRKPNGKGNGVNGFTVKTPPGLCAWPDHVLALERRLRAAEAGELQAKLAHDPDALALRRRELRELADQLSAAKVAAMERDLERHAG
jgi:hypothetical protein